MSDFELNLNGPLDKKPTPRDIESYTAAELAAMDSQHREFIRTTIDVRSFYRFLDMFELSWGFPCDVGCGCPQVLPWREITDQELKTLARCSGGHMVDEIRAIATKAKADRAERESHKGEAHE